METLQHSDIPSDPLFSLPQHFGGKEPPQSCVCGDKKLNTNTRLAEHANFFLERWQMPDWFTETNSSPMPPNAVSKWRQLVFESGVNTLGDGSLNLKYDGEVGLFVFWLFAILHERNRAFFPWLQTTRCLLCLILWLDFVPVGSHFHEATTKVSPCKITFTNYNSHSLSPIHHLYVSWIFLDIDTHHITCIKWN